MMIRAVAQIASPGVKLDNDLVEVKGKGQAPWAEGTPHGSLDRQWNSAAAACLQVCSVARLCKARWILTLWAAAPVHHGVVWELQGGLEVLQQRCDGA